METRWYPAVVEHGSEPGYSVFFPDLPGCVSAGDNLQDTANQAAEALALHVEGMLEDGTALPPPSTLDDIRVDSEVQQIGRILVPVELPGRSLRINITMDEGLGRAGRSRGLEARPQSQRVARARRAESDRDGAGQRRVAVGVRTASPSPRRHQR